MTVDKNLPPSWIWAKIKDLGLIVSGGTPKTSEPSNFDGNIPWITPADLTGYTAKTIGKGRKSISQKGLEASSAKLMPKRTVLFSSRAPIGYVAIAGNDLATNQGFKSVIVDESLDEEFVYYYLKSAKQLAENAASGTTFKEISGSRFAELPIPVAPLNEQHQIVEKIETLFARLDKAEEAVREVQKLLKQYRQSVLKAAVTGELTIDWRAENKDKLEPASDLLSRILKTRRENWQGRGKYKEPAEPDTSDLPDLPEGWIWASLEQLFEVYGGATPSRKEKGYWGGKIPWVSSGEVAFCRIAETSETITSEGYASCSTKLHPPGTILLAMIGEGKTRGQAAILDIEACNNQNAAAIRVSETEVPVEYIYYYLMGSYEDNRLKGQGGNQPALNGGKVKQFNVPVPPINEMLEVSRLVEDVFSSTDLLETWCETELKRSASLRQSILKDAFSGKLVPQDPEDESASELLARIKAENDATKPAPKHRKVNA